MGLKCFKALAFSEKQQKQFKVESSKLSVCIITFWITSKRSIKDCINRKDNGGKNNKSYLINKKGNEEKKYDK